MDSKRAEYQDKRTDKDFYGDYYSDFLEAKREVVYAIEDITVERPSWKDFKHVLKCIIDDENISYDELINSPQQDTMYKVVQRVAWFFGNSDQDDVYLIFKNNEYAGFFCLIPPSIIQKLVATEMKIRTKFKRTMVFIAAADAIINKMYPTHDLTLEGTNEKRWKKYTLSLDLEVVTLQVFKKDSKQIIHNIIKKRMQRGIKK